MLKNILAFLLLLLVYPHLATAQVLLFPNGERPPGELGALMGGAQVALASGTEAAWYNPAGMAKENRTVLTGSGIGAGVEEIQLGGSGETSYQPAPGFVSFTTSALPPRASHRLSYGFFAFWPVENITSTQILEDSLIAQQGLPSTLVGSLDLDSLFPDGIARSENSAAAGSLVVFTAGTAMGYEGIEGFRMGISARWERVEFSGSSDSSVVFTAGGTDTTTGDLTGFRHTSIALLGEAERLVYTLGLQIDFGRWLTAGLTFRPESRSHAGIGSFRLAQSSGLQVSDSGTVLTDAQEYSLIAEDSLPFELKLPAEIKLGFALQLEAFTLEVDWSRTRKLGSYQVFPQVSSDPVSTRSLQIDPLETSQNEVDRYAAGLAIPVGGSGSMLFGYAQDRSAVPLGDAVFRTINLETISGGYYLTRGSFSGSVGMAYKVAKEPATEFPRVGGQTSATADVAIKSYALLAGASYIF